MPVDNGDMLSGKLLSPVVTRYLVYLQHQSFYQVEQMRSPWLAAVLSPALVGLVLYLFGTIFAVERVYLNYTPNEPVGRTLSLWSHAINFGSPEKKYSHRLAPDTEIGRPLK